MFRLRFGAPWRKSVDARVDVSAGRLLRVASSVSRPSGGMLPLRWGRRRSPRWETHKVLARYRLHRADAGRCGLRRRCVGSGIGGRVFCSCLFYRALGNGSCCPCRALLCQRARFAGRLRRGAGQRSEIHDGLVVDGRRRFAEGFTGQRGIEFLSGAGVDRFFDVEQPPQHPIDIAVDYGAGQVIGHRANGGCRVVAHAAQRPHVFEFLRKISPNCSITWRAAAWRLRARL